MFLSFIISYLFLEIHFYKHVRLKLFQIEIKITVICVSYLSFNYISDNGGKKSGNIFEYLSNKKD